MSVERRRKTPTNRQRTGEVVETRFPREVLSLVRSDEVVANKDCNGRELRKARHNSEKWKDERVAV
jgi:hypothetical protein